MRDAGDPLDERRRMTPGCGTLGRRDPRPRRAARPAAHQEARPELRHRRQHRAPIVRAARVEPGDDVLEVGPGSGRSRSGCSRPARASSPSRSTSASPPSCRSPSPQLAAGRRRSPCIHRGRPAGHRAAGAPTRLVANLPYNVSVPVLLHLLEHFPSLETALVMVQAEVGQRLAAAARARRSTARPSVKAAWYGTLVDGRHRSAARCSGRCPTSTRSSWRSSRGDAAGHRGRARRDLRAHRCRVRAAPQDAAAGALGRALGRLGRRIRSPRGGGYRPDGCAARSSPCADFLAIARAAPVALAETGRSRESTRLES